MGSRKGNGPESPNVYSKADAASQEKATIDDKPQPKKSLNGYSVANIS